MKDLMKGLGRGILFGAFIAMFFNADIAVKEAILGIGFILAGI